MEHSDFYSVLGVPSSATQADIKKAYHRLALMHHPDRNPGDAKAAERFRIISEAYQFLSDEGKRAAYDMKTRGYQYYEPIAHVEYMVADVDVQKVKLNEEVELTFSFPAEGRFFKKPVLHDWEITAGPTVAHRYIWKDGSSVKETVLHYTVCPIRTGLLKIPSASINFNRHPVVSNSLQVEVKANQCYFKSAEEAGSKPYHVLMHRTSVTSTSVYRKTIIHQRVVLLPRSELAAWYHKVGRTMKILFALLGGAWALVNGHNFFLGMMTGSLVAGVNVHLMYRLMGIKSVFYYAHHHPIVLEYEACGYKLGPEPNDGLFGPKRWTLIKSLFY